MYWIVLASLGAVALLVIVSATNIPGGYKLYSVQSGSMHPTIPTGSLVVIQPTNSYRVRDVVTFKTENKTPVTHRLHRIENDVYTTKGDANDAVDSEPIKKDQILGKVIYSLPYIGFPISFAKSKEGFVLLIVIPGTLIIYSEILNIKNEILKLIKKKHEKNTK